MNSPYVNEVLNVFTSHGNPIDSLAMAKYMKNKFVFRGIKSPQGKLITKHLLEGSRIPSKNEVTGTVNELWKQPWREVHYFALALMQKYAKNPEAEWISFYENLITRNSWWDSVDGIAVWLVGNYFKKYPELIIPTTSRWMASENIWLQRTCLIFQLGYGKTTDFELMKSFIIPLAGSREFFIQKAIGWSLRQYYKTNPETVIDFVQHNTLPRLSAREALKHHS